MSDVEETIAVPKKATEAMAKAGAKFAMQAAISSKYRWPDYVSDLWAVMAANAPATKPDSPVCVEAKKLKWERVEGASDDGDAWFAQFGDLLRYEIWQTREGFDWCMTANGEVDLCEVRRCPTLEAAQAACQSDVERRTLELVNTRSVESVKAELLKALHAKALKETNVRFNGDVAEWLERAGEDLRSLTEGEG